MDPKKTFEDLDLSKDEVKRLSDALKDEKFRKMLVEYAEEISDPENRRKAEEEIAMMENERGMNVQFIHPQPGYVIKTTVDGSEKAFINICQNEKVEKPVAKREKGPDGNTGMMWQIPHSFAPPKEDRDKSKQSCRVYDVVFHPDTYRMATTNARFKKLVEDTALDGIERQFGVKLDKKNVKYPKMEFKGIPTATVIREKIPEHSELPIEPDSIINKMPYPYDGKTSAEKSKDIEEKAKKNQKNKMTNGKAESEEATEPKYSITHRSELDMSEYRNAPDAKTSTRPKALVVKIEVPLLKSAGQLSLDIFEKRLLVESVTPAKYKLDLALPYPVNDDEGSAKFDKAKRTLTVTLPVIPDKIPTMPFVTTVDQNGSHAFEDVDNVLHPSPLIEVLTPDEKPNSEPKMKENGLASHNAAPDNDNAIKNKFPQSVKWNLPDFQYSQDKETASFVIKVQSVEEEWIQTFFPQETIALIQFMSMGAGCFPVYYSLFIEFPEGCNVSPDHCSIDTSADNLVFVILKGKDCRVLWDSFKVGTDDTQLETRHFLTESNLKAQLSTLQEESQEPEMPGLESPQLHVTEMNHHKLTIDIKPAKPKKKQRKNSHTEDEDEEEEDSFEAPSSAEIKVIHRKPCPKNLHGILKQRTISESSEDFYSLNDDQISPRSGEEADPLSSSSSSFKRRSVSFNNYTDHVSFKSTQAPSSMTVALKSKRRRQRKREGKRSISEGSHTSEGSSEEHPHAYYDTHSEEENDAFDSVDNEKEDLTTTTSPPPPQDPTPQKASESVSIPESKPKESSGSGKKKSKRNRNKKASALKMNSNKEGECSDHSELEERYSDQPSSQSSVDVSPTIAGNSNGVDFRTKSEKSVEDNTSEITWDTIFNSKKDTNTEQDSKVEQKPAVNGDSADDKARIAKNKQISSDIKNKMAADKVSGGGDAVTNGKEDSDDDAEGEVNLADLGAGDVAKEVTPEPEESDIKTMLSWEDPPPVNGDHVTQCAVMFNNALMFDLDVD